MQISFKNKFKHADNVWPANVGSLSSEDSHRNSTSLSRQFFIHVQWYRKKNKKNKIISHSNISNNFNFKNEQNMINVAV